MYFLLTMRNLNQTKIHLQNTFPWYALQSQVPMAKEPTSFKLFNKLCIRLQVVI